MPALPHVPGQDALQMLLSRHSRLPLIDPAPSDKDLELIFAAALRAPDHGRLRPWRFVLIRGDSRNEFGELLVDIAASKMPAQARETFEFHRQKAHVAPMAIAIGAHVSEQPGIPEVEQLLSVGAAAMNLLNALHLLGYGGFWVTGPDSYDPDLRKGLDFDPADHLFGFLLVGTPAPAAEAPPRPAWNEHVREWLGRPSI